MATLAQIWTLLEDPGLKEKVSAACLKAANTIRLEATETANHANRIKWAKSVLVDPVKAGDDMLKAVLAINASAELVAITGASDATIESAVVEAVNIFADGS